jgi:manganese/zinc/iron transport system substrate-binding protein
VARNGLVTAFLVLASLAVGCAPEGRLRAQNAAPRYPIRAIATVGMVADIVRNVGGPHVEVTQIMGAGVDPHLYKATRDDVELITTGDVVFYSGLMLEGKMIDTLVKVARTKPVYAVTEMIEPEFLLEPEDFAGHYDPHVWMDASAWAKCVDAAAKALGEFDAAHAAEYAENAKRYRRELDKLHEYGKKSIATVPDEQRVLITSHDAFNYFGRAYRLAVQGVQGISTESEAGLQRINELVDLIVDRKIKAVFVETSVPRKNVEAIVAGARSRGHEVKIGGELYSDAMGEQGTYEGTYIGMLDHNITLAARALGGEAPQRGFQGKLTPR